MKQTPVKAGARNSTLRASTASSANRTSKSQGTSKKPKAMAAPEAPPAQPRQNLAIGKEPVQIHKISPGSATELKSLQSPPKLTHTVRVAHNIARRCAHMGQLITRGILCITTNKKDAAH